MADHPLPKFPDLSKIEAGEASEFARKLLIEFVKQTAEKRGVSYRAIARVTGLHPSNISRVLSGRYSPEIDTFLKICGALNLRIVLKE